MTRISSNLLSDTLNLIQLARETALANGKTEQAQRLSPLVNEMRGVVSTAREPLPVAPAASGPTSSVAPAPGLMGESGFRALLDASARPAGAASPLVQASRPAFAAAPAAPAQAAMPPASLGAAGTAERGQMVTAMARGGMSELDIARQMGMTRDEVKMMLNIFGG